MRLERQRLELDPFLFPHPDHPDRAEDRHRSIQTRFNPVKFTKADRLLGKEFGNRRNTGTGGHHRATLGNRHRRGTHHRDTQSRHQRCLKCGNDHISPIHIDPDRPQGLAYRRRSRPDLFRNPILGQSEWCCALHDNAAGIPVRRSVLDHLSIDLAEARKDKRCRAHRRRTGHDRTRRDNYLTGTDLVAGVRQHGRPGHATPDTSGHDLRQRGPAMGNDQDPVVRFKNEPGGGQCLRDRSV